MLLLFYSLNSFAQLTENFNDGDFSNNPVWVGGTADWVINSSLQLQSNNTVANSTYYLSTSSTKATTAQWEFFTLITFNPSSVNYVDIFLTASASDLTQSATTGYFVRLGGTDDEICLYRKDAGTITKIIDGADGSLNNSNNAIQIKVVRDAANQWQLTRTVNGTPAFNEGNVIDATYLSSAFFGVLVKQSTAGFFQRHFIDDIIVGDFVPDVLPPLIQTFTVTSANSLDILFNEPVDQSSSELVSNYFVDHGVGSPITATRDLVNISLVHLVFGGNFPNSINLQITINGVNDLSANATNNLTGIFSYFIPEQYNVIIDELMADPDPQVGLPDVEWLELKNTTAFDINLQGWTLGKATGASGPMPAYLLKADSFVIVCTGSAVAALSVFGPAISVTSFPSLSNDADLIYLRSSGGTIIHAVNYNDSWYQNQLKEDGGWTLEMIDTHNPCSGFSNWKASVDPRGGTPSQKNSADAVNPDQVAPALVRAYTLDNTNIILVFSEPLDSVKAAVPSNYSISNGIGNAVSAIPLGPLFDRVKLVLGTPIQDNQIYTVTASALTDCVNNTIGSSNTAKLGLPASTVNNFDIVINEILFNPRPTSNDYVELYNRSNKILDLKNVSIANAADFTHITTEPYVFFPGDFIIITESRDLVLHDYVANNPGAFIEVTSMPSYNDDAGDVRILNEQGNNIDEVTYLDDWQFPLISNVEGVALERIDYDAASQNAANWHSASTSIGYGTPTYKNSQFRVDAGPQGEIKIDPEIFSPDNDGRDDVATINYNFPEPGYVTNITIFDAAGRLVKFLQRNALSGIKGYYRWDGLGDKNQKLPVGIYVVYTEIFNLQGKTKKFKNTIVLARKQ